MNLLNNIKKFFRGQTQLELENVIALQQMNIEALTAGMTLTYNEYQRYIFEVQKVLKPLVLQYGGKLLIQKEFVEAANDLLSTFVVSKLDEEGNYTLGMKDVEIEQK